MSFMLPEILLILGLFTLFAAGKSTQPPDSKMIFNISRLFLALSLLVTIIVYDKCDLAPYFINNSYTTIIKIIIYFYAIVWLELSSRWFANKNRNGWFFCFLCLAQILCFILLISAQPLGLIFILLLLISTLNYLMLGLRRKDDSDENVIKKYVASALFLNACFGVGLLLLGVQPVVASLLFLPLIFFLLGLAPFHFGFVELVGKSILPVSGFIAIIPAFAYFALLNNLISNSVTNLTMQIFGMMSLFVGSIYAFKEQNIRKLFAYSSVFHFGFICIGFSFDNPSAKFASFTYLFVYILSQFGIFTTFFGLKSNGEYQKDLPSLSGISNSYPYIVASFLIFLISLMGCPPIIGFLGRLSVINYLVTEHEYYLIFGIFVALMILIYAYLLIIKSLYFQPQVKHFDRIDDGVYLVLVVTIFLVIISTVKPVYIITYLQNLLEKI